MTALDNIVKQFGLVHKTAESASHQTRGPGGKWAYEGKGKRTGGSGRAPFRHPGADSPTKLKNKISEVAAQLHQDPDGHVQVKRQKGPGSPRGAHDVIQGPAKVQGDSILIGSPVHGVVRVTPHGSFRDIKYVKSYGASTPAEQEAWRRRAFPYERHAAGDDYMPPPSRPPRRRG
jgi:hypothetical protein